MISNAELLEKIYNAVMNGIQQADCSNKDFQRGCEHGALAMYNAMVSVLMDEDII